jgi:hypothetical protein
MTKRVCIFGNSHVGALKEAWTDNPGRWPEVKVQFVGAHKDLLLQTASVNGRLVATSDPAKRAFQTLSGIEAVNLRDFDAFVVAGCLVSLANAANTYRDCRWIGLPSLESATNLADGPERLVSYPAARDTIAASLATRLGPRFAAHLRNGTDRPIYLTSQPRVSASIKAKRRVVTRAHHVALENGDADGLSAVFEDAAARAMTEHGAPYIPPPPEPIEDGILTARPYMDGAHRLTAGARIKQPNDDIMHANARYGALVLDQIMAAVA